MLKITRRFSVVTYYKELLSISLHDPSMSSREVKGKSRVKGSDR